MKAKLGRMRRARSAGFSLIELMAVLVILGILMVVLLPRLTGAGERARERLTRAYLAQVDAAISEYENRFGDFPPSQFIEKWGTQPNGTNLGGEALVLSLWSTEWDGVGLSEDKLVNLDGDETKKVCAKFPRPSLFELADEWGNPIAYFHRRDYGRTDAYSLEDPDTGERRESSVTAVKDATTGNFHNPQTYQLISAGADGTFGTADDIANFESD